MPRIASALLLALCLNASALQAQTDSSEPEEQTLSSRLQQELNELEQQRASLAAELDQLRQQPPDTRLQQLQTQNLSLREQLAEHQQRLEASSDMEPRLQQQWFMIGAATVTGSLLLGFLLGRSGGRRKRSEWLN